MSQTLWPKRSLTEGLPCGVEKGSKGSILTLVNFKKSETKLFGSQIWGSRRVGKGGLVEGGGELNKNTGTAELSVGARPHPS